MSGDFSMAALAERVSEDLLALSDPETLKVRLRAWLRSDARAQQLWGELENLGTVARCDANKELLKILIPLAQYVLGLELKQLGAMRALVQRRPTNRPPSRGRASGRGAPVAAAPEPEPESPGLGKLDLKGLLIRDVADVPAVDASPVRRLARALGTEREEKDAKRPGAARGAGTAPGAAVAEPGAEGPGRQGDRAALTALARKVHRVLDVGAEKFASKENVIVRQVRASPPVKRPTGVEDLASPAPSPKAATPMGSVSSQKAASPQYARVGSASRARGGRSAAGFGKPGASPTSQTTPIKSRGSLPTAGAAAATSAVAPKKPGADAGVQTDPLQTPPTQREGEGAAGGLLRDGEPVGVDDRQDRWIASTSEKGRKKAAGAGSKKEREEKDEQASQASRAGAGGPSAADEAGKRKPKAKPRAIDVPSSRPASPDAAAAAEAAAPRREAPRPEVAARQPLAADEGRIRILEEENTQLRGRLAKDKEEKAKLNLELEELRFQVESLLKKLRQKGGAEIESLLEGDEFVKLLEKSCGGGTDVFNRLYNDALARIGRLKELRQRVLSQHERELQRVLPVVAKQSRGKLERPQTVPGLELSDPAPLTDAELFCEETLRCLRSEDAERGAAAQWYHHADLRPSRTAPIRTMVRTASGPHGTGQLAWRASVPGRLEVAGSRARIASMGAPGGHHPFRQTFPRAGEPLPVLEKSPSASSGMPLNPMWAQSRYEVAQ